VSDIDNTWATAMIVALEALNLPPLPSKVRIMMDQNKPHLTKLLRALADELENPGTGAAALDALPPSARALGRLLHNEPYLIRAGLLDTLKRTQALDAQCQRLAQQNAELERTMIPDNRLN
jgi:hypothetical protein